MKTRKWKIGMLMMVLVSVLLVPALAVASGVTTVGLPSGYGPLQAGQGGEFTLKPDADLSYLLATYASTTRDFVETGTFQTFCIEGTEYIQPWAFHSAVLNDKAMMGSNSPNGDPLSYGAAYLYHEFQLGILKDYKYASSTEAEKTIRKASAAQLQTALWWLEGEKSLGYDASNPYEQQVVTWAGSEALAKANNNWRIPVGVLNLTYNGQLAQDVLVCLPVSEPGILLLLGTGMLGLALVGRKTRRQRV